MHKPRIVLKVWAVLFTITISLFTWTVVYAERICPKGQSHRRDLCYEVKEKRDGTAEVYPVGQSHRIKETWVIDRDRGEVYRKGQSHKSGYGDKWEIEE